jgi:membrane protease YdiL (CAAX protease family)
LKGLKVKKNRFGTYIEPLILYTVLFFQIPGTVPMAEIVEFSPYTEIIRIFLYNLPSLALIWYLLLKTRRLGNWGVGFSPRRDLISLGLSLPALVLIGLTVSKVSPYISGISSGPRFLPPGDAVSWVILVFSCLSTAYLEESFFRFYLLSRRAEMGIGPNRAVLISVLLFSVCHIYAGPWGFLNAALSGVVLAFVFLKFRSLHGIAVAHAMYNILVYVLYVYFP